MMRRRTCVGVAIALGPASMLGVRSQMRSRPSRVAIVLTQRPLSTLEGTEPADLGVRRFVHRLRDLGYVEGKEFTLERRSDEGHRERLAALMKEVVELPVDVIVTIGDGAQPAARATSTIPIVVLVEDPVGLGLTATLVRPSGNVTGLTEAPEQLLHGKRLQLLKEVFPKAARVAVLDFKYVDSRITPGTHARRRQIEAAAGLLGMTPVWAGADTVDQLDQAFASIVAQRADSLIEMGNDILWKGRRAIVDFAARERMPAVYSANDFAESGGLLAYGPDYGPVWPRLADDVDKILKGARVADLPFEQLTTFKLVVNMKAAKALGLAIPQSILVSATEVIQ